MKLPTGVTRAVFIFARPAGHVGAPRYCTPYFEAQGI